MTNDQARAVWAASGLTYSIINKQTLERLRDLIEAEMAAGEYMKSTFRCDRKITIQRNRLRFFAGLTCKSFYFKGREAVSFNDDGFIGFAGWADSTNVQPVLQGFVKWVAEMQAAKNKPAGSIISSDCLKAITLWQPWASAMALEMKRIETRSWATNYRGPLLIHASARRPTEIDMSVLRHPEVSHRLALDNIDSKQFPLGSAVCIVNLVDCVPVESIRDNITLLERVLGNYCNGRYAWVTEFLHYIDKPIPMKGGQRFWNCDMGWFCDDQGNPIAALDGLTGSRELR